MNAYLFQLGPVNKFADSSQEPGADRMSGEELLRRFFQGDERAFESIVDMYKDELTSFINGIVSDAHEAEYLMIETFARLAVGGSRFSERSSLKTYLFTIGKNLAFRYLKKRKTQHFNLDAVIGLASALETPEAAAERNEEAQRIHQAMVTLKADHRTILTLLYIEGMSYAEAGRVMKKSNRQVEGLARRAKSALKCRLEENAENL